ncbi:MAG: protein containing YHS domain protein [Nitrospiraceae bacterium]|nr:protein containing YHS domain protein [Nitrospiraceae bacterium]
MTLKIGVMGSASGGLTKKHRQTAYNLGRAIAENGCITVTGACPGLPFESARGAKEAGGMVVGISPGLSTWEHVHKYQSPLEHHDVLIFTGSGLMGREVVNIRTSDIVVIIGGRSGTLGEFSIAYDEGKLIGVVLGTGGITREIKYILRVIKKKTGAQVIYDQDPERLVKSLLAYFRKEHYKHPNVHHAFVVDGHGEKHAVPAPKK